MWDVLVFVSHIADLYFNCLSIGVRENCRADKCARVKKVAMMDFWCDKGRGEEGEIR